MIMASRIAMLVLLAVQYASGVPGGRDVHAEIVQAEAPADALEAMAAVSGATGNANVDEQFFKPSICDWFSTDPCCLLHTKAEQIACMDSAGAPPSPPAKSEACVEYCNCGKDAGGGHSWFGEREDDKVAELWLGGGGRDWFNKCNGTPKVKRSFWFRTRCVPCPWGEIKPDLHKDECIVRTTRQISNERLLSAANHPR